jgi:hypothetical protein
VARGLLEHVREHSPQVHRRVLGCVARHVVERGRHDDRIDARPRRAMNEIGFASPSLLRA